MVRKKLAMNANWPLRSVRSYLMYANMYFVRKIHIDEPQNEKFLYSYFD